eukprot:4040945-Ditylum_brightwellii.AAC.1
MSDAQSSKSNQNNATALSSSNLSNDTDLVSETSSTTTSDTRQSKNNDIVLPPLRSIWGDKMVIRCDNHGTNSAMWHYKWCDRKFKGLNATKAFAHISRG